MSARASLFRASIARRVAIVALGAVGLSGVGMAAATAAPASCPAGYGCAWKDQNYLTAGASTPRVVFLNNVANFTTISGTWDNQVTSIFNNGTTGAGIYWYTDINYGGSRLTLAKGAGIPQLNVTHPLFNDRISSATFY